MNIVIDLKNSPNINAPKADVINTSFARINNNTFGAVAPNTITPNKKESMNDAIKNASATKNTLSHFAVKNLFLFIGRINCIFSAPLEYSPVVARQHATTMNIKRIDMTVDILVSVKA